VKIINSIKSIDIFEVIRFSFVGVIVTAIHYGVYLFFNLWFQATIAYTIGYLLSFTCNYLLSNYFTFKTKPNVKSGFGFALSHLINYFLHIILLKIFLAINISETLAPLPVFMIVIPLNFLLVRFFLKKYSRNEKSINNDPCI